MLELEKDQIAIVINPDGNIAEIHIPASEAENGNNPISDGAYLAMILVHTANNEPDLMIQARDRLIAFIDQLESKPKAKEIITDVTSL